MHNIEGDIHRRASRSHGVNVMAFKTPHLDYPNGRLRTQSEKYHQYAAFVYSVGQNSTMHTEMITGLKIMLLRLGARVRRLIAVSQ